MMLAAAAALLTAAPSAANRLLKEEWLARASYEQVKEVIAKGADIEAVQRHHNFTPLLVVARAGNLGALRALLEAGADPNRPPRPGWDVALHWAADGEVVALLHEYGAALNLRSRTGQTPLHWAARESHLSAMRELIGRGAEVDARSGKGRTPVYSAEGRTPLHRAARSVDPVAAKILLEAGADRNAENAAGIRPLHIAARYNGPEMIDTLLDAGADPTLEDVEGRTPADVAKGNWRLAGSGALKRLKAAVSDVPPARSAATVACDGHVVQPSERKLGDVAAAALGDRSRWPEIAKLNGITAEKPHRAGQCLKLPG